MKPTDTPESIEHFETFLGKAAQSQELSELVRKTNQGPHCSESDLKDYIANRLEPVKAAKIGEHVIFCAHCSRIVSRLEQESSSSMVDSRNIAELWEEAVGDQNRFEEFLSIMEGSPDFLLRRNRYEKLPMPERSVLIDFIEKRLKPELDFEIMERASFDRRLAREIDFLVGKCETSVKVRKWLDDRREELIASFRNVFGPITQPEFALMWGPVRERVTTPEFVWAKMDRDRPYSVSEIPKLILKSRISGYVWVFCYTDEIDSIEWLIPAKAATLHAISDNVEIKFPLPSGLAPGRYYVRVIHTKEKVIHCKEVDFSNRFAALEFTCDFMRLLEHLPSHQWASTETSFRIVD